MWWNRDDDVVDELIANNAARPIPGMEKPDATKFALTQLGVGDNKPKTRRRTRKGRSAAPPDQLLVRERLRANRSEIAEA